MWYKYRKRTITMTKMQLMCHDCEREMVITDNYNEIELADIKHCPLCGGEDNIEVIEKGSRNE